MRASWLLLLPVFRAWRLGDLSHEAGLAPTLETGGEPRAAAYLRTFERYAHPRETFLEGTAVAEDPMALKRWRRTPPLAVQHRNATTLTGQQMPAVIFTLAELQFLLGVFSVDPPKLMFTFVSSYREMNRLSRYRDISKNYANHPLYFRLHELIDHLVSPRRSSRTSTSTSALTSSTPTTPASAAPTEAPTQAPTEAPSEVPAAPTETPAATPAPTETPAATPAPASSDAAPPATPAPADQPATTPAPPPAPAPAPSPAAAGMERMVMSLISDLEKHRRGMDGEQLRDLRDMYTTALNLVTDDPSPAQLEGSAAVADYTNLCDWIKVPRPCRFGMSRKCLHHTIGLYGGHHLDADFLPRLRVGHVSLPRSPKRALRAILEIACNPWVEDLHGDTMVYLPSSSPFAPASIAGRWDTTTSTSTQSTSSTQGGGTVKPNDPKISEQWHLADMNVYKAWGVTKGSSKVIVMVADTGVQPDHPDLMGNFWTNPSPGNAGYGNDVHGINTIDNNANFADVGGHGTNMAGIVAAVTNNQLGVAGIGWNIRLIPCRFIGPSGGQMSNFNKCLDYAVSNGVHIVSMSFGGDTGLATTTTAAAKASMKGLLLVAAAGDSGTNNDKGSGTWPANLSLRADTALISVAAYNQSQQLTKASAYGFSSVSLGAPGEYVLGTAENSDYAFYAGTSPATPCVAGVAALMKAANSKLTGFQIKQGMQLAVTPMSALRDKTSWGGKPDAYVAVQKAMSMS